MAVHIFVLNEENYEKCILNGVAAIPDGNKANTMDALISRMALIREGDHVLFYITGKKELRGVFKAQSRPFYDTQKIWPQEEQLYPLRIRIDNSKYVFPTPIRLSDIYDLRDTGKIWTFTLKRFMTTNVMFSISDQEFSELLNLYLKLNPVYSKPKPIQKPYPYREPDLKNYLACNCNEPKFFEYTLMSLLSNDLAEGKFKHIFGDYSDYLSYVSTSFEREIDMLLIFNHPEHPQQIIAYNILELKKDKFDTSGLKQLLQYEDWFLRKKAHGDSSMLRTTAIAQKFDSEVINYLKKRKEYENKSVTLLKYEYVSNELILNEVPF